MKTPLLRVGSPMLSPKHLPRAVRLSRFLLLILCGCWLFAETSVAQVTIQEILAENDGGLRDEDGDDAGWIELFNAGSTAVNLGGWRLTDDASSPAKWTFPAVSIAPGGYLVVFASGKNRAVAGQTLHTSFKLDPDGEYLALFQADGTPASVYSPAFPRQRRNISFAKVGETGGVFFATPTPGAVNAQGYDGFVADPAFSVRRGFFSGPFETAISSPTPGAQIRFTTNGSVPTATAGAEYTGPIPITQTTILRAAVFLPNWIPSNVETQSYFFLAEIPRQSANPPGWPATWGTDNEVNNNDGARDGTVVSDYEMDPNVVNNTLPGYGVVDALGALPSLSIALPLADFLGPNGIYQKPLSSDGPNANPPLWERACSAEFLNPDGTALFHENCGIQIHGNSSRRPYRLQKHSFDLKFKARYGAGKLSEQVFPDDAVDKFNSLVLRGCFTDAWALVSWDAARYRPDNALYFRDIWAKRAFRDMGWTQTTSRFAHLYINGLYWGIYDVSEDLDTDFFADHLGGLPEDWDIIADFTELKAGNITGWNTVFTIANAGLSSAAAYANIQQHVDLVNFADYYLLHVHIDAEDWPHHNWYAARNRNSADTRFRHYVWDQEIMFDSHSIRRLLATDLNSNIDRTPGRLFQQLRANPEFRLLFADRAHKHLHNDGALSLGVSQSRWDGLASSLDRAIAAESARWGDVAAETPYGPTPSKTVYTREADWLPVLQSVRNTYLPSLFNNANNYATIKELRAAALYPVTEPPAFNVHGGSVPPGSTLIMTAPAGTIYYTFHGVDPREPVTGNAVGTPYSGPVTLTQSATVKARVRNGTEWSALTEALFSVDVPASAANLVITEVYYNPPSTNDLEEYLELTNLSATSAIALGGAYFTEGVTFTFPAGFALGAGQRVVLVRDHAAFTAQFGNLPIAGVYSGALDNAGETIALAAADDTEILRFSYNDELPWSPSADGEGRSLVLLAPRNLADRSLAESWRASISAGGTPGSVDSVSFAGVPLADADRDGWPALLEYVFGTDDALASSTPSPLASLQALDGQSFLTLTFQHQAGADDALVTAEYAPDLSGGWARAIFVSRTASGLETWRYPAPATDAPQFLRLRADLP